MSEVIQRSVEEAQEIAKSKGLVAIIPTKSELQIDLDGNADRKLDERLIQILSDNGIVLRDRLVTISRNKNRHVYFRLNVELGHYQRMILQAALGSDPVREVLAMIRCREGSDAPLALFENKAQAKRVELWRKTEAEALAQALDDDVPF